jgi:hypothetical protein
MTNMFKMPTPPTPPVPAPVLPPRMPDPTAPDALAAQRKAMLAAQQGGYSSTILTRNNTMAGSTLAGSQKLGA